MQRQLMEIPPAERDAWVDRAFGLGAPPDDGPELPRGCVPYFPCAVDVVMRAVEHANVTAEDVFVDVGAGIGRVTTLVHLLTGARAIGVEIQPALVRAARELAMRMRADGVVYVEGDAIDKANALADGTVFFLYCPFSGERLARLLAALEPIARTRPIRICCVDLPLPPCAWLTCDPPLAGDLAIWRSAIVAQVERSVAAPRP
ncbi:MAG TPA: methyltransferase domain-containing protein [Labilithrix sp.]